MRPYPDTPADLPQCADTPAFSLDITGQTPVPTGIAHTTEENTLFAIKAEVVDRHAKVFTFTEQKTMYGGKHVAAGDSIFIFASENEGESGLIAVGTVISASAVPKKPGVQRKTPRVSVVVRFGRSARQPLGRTELKSYSNWTDGKPETELNFKLYRQATNKIIGVTSGANLFLRKLF